MTKKMERKVKKPLKIGDTLEISLISKGKNGDGLGYYGDSNFVVIVDGGRKGTTVKTKINFVAKDCAFGELLEVIK